MLSDYVAKEVMSLSTHPSFDTVWNYFRKQAGVMVEEILSSSTDPVSREVLVRLHEVFHREVVDLPSMAVKQLDRKSPDKSD